MFNISLSPPQIEFVLKPGITLIQAYQITNNSQESITLNTEVLPFLPQGDNGSVSYSSLLANPNISFSLNNADLKLGQPFTLAPQESRQLVLKIKTSPQTETSDYYSTFFVYQSSNLSANDTSISQSIGKIGSHVLLSVSETEFPKTEGNVKKFIVTPKIKDVFFTPINFSAKIQNNTNYFFKSLGKITISKNEKIVKQLNLDSQNILANHNRLLLCENQTTCTLSPPLWPGNYTATLEFDPNLNIPTSSITFLILPLSPIAFILSIIFLIYSFRWFKKLLTKNVDQ
jgi:hypothetical protein